MNTVSYTSARQNLAKTMEQVCRDHTPTIITRQNHHDVVMLSLEDYNAWQETLYLLSSTENAKRLFKSIKQKQTGKVTKRKLAE